MRALVLTLPLCVLHGTHVLRMLKLLPRPPLTTRCSSEDGVFSLREREARLDHLCGRERTGGEKGNEVCRLRRAHLPLGEEDVGR